MLQHHALQASLEMLQQQDQAAFYTCGSFGCQFLQPLAVDCWSKLRLSGRQAVSQAGGQAGSLVCWLSDMLLVVLLNVGHTVRHADSD